MANEIKLKINGDASGLIAAVNAAVSQIEKRLSSLKIPTGLASTGGGGSTAGTIVQGLAGRDASRGAGDNRALATAELQREGNKTLKEILTVLQKQTHQIQVASSKQGPSPTNMPGGTSPTIGPSTPGSAAGFKMGAGGITSFGGLASSLGAPAAVLGAAATTAFALKAGESIRKAIFEAQYEARALQTQAFNTKGQAGQLLESAINGGGLEDVMFARERAAGQASAASMIGARHGSYNEGGALEDRLKAAFPRFTSTVLEAEHGRFSQAATALFTPTVYRAGIEAEKTGEAAKQTQIERDRPENKTRTLIREQYLRDYQNNLGFQRQTGMSEDQFRNFNIANTNAGFMPEQGQGASSAIMAAGGGTRNAKGNASFALQMGRQFDLTNAPQALGSIGGQLGSAQLSKDALIKVQAEGTRLGLNQSDLREENRRFVEMASAAIGGSSVTSKEGVADILQTFGRFMQGANTTQSLTAGKSAYEAYQGASKSQAGPEAVLRQAGMRKDANLGKLSELDRTALSLMPENEVTSDSERVKSMAAKSGLTPTQIVDSYRKNVQNSLFVLPSTRKALASFRKAAAGLEGKMSPDELKKRQAEFSAARGELQIAETYSGVTAGMDERTQNQFNEGLLEKNVSKEARDRMNETAKKEAESGKLPRGGDEATAQAAQLAKLSNELFKTMQTDISNTATATADFTTKINALIKAYQTGDIKAINKLTKEAFGPGAATQPQAGGGGTPATEGQ